MSLGLWASIGEVIVRGMMVVAGYITNSSTFPQPLSEEEEAKYLGRLQQGDEDARSVLIERNLRLVAHIVNTSWPKLQAAPTQARQGVSPGRAVTGFEKMSAHSGRNCSRRAEYFRQPYLTG